MLVARNTWLNATFYVTIRFSIQNSCMKSGLVVVPRAIGDSGVARDAATLPGRQTTPAFLGRYGVPVGRDGHRARAYSHGIRSSPDLTSPICEPIDKTCFSAGSLNLELQASSEVRATCGHDGCGAIVATGDGSGRGVGGTELGSGPYRLRTAAAVVIQCVLRGNLARRQVATSDRYHDVCVRHARLIQADERPVTGEMLARMQLTVDEERRRRAEAEGELAAAQEQLRGARAAVRKLEEDRVAMEQEALGLGDQLVRQAVEHAQVDVRDGGPRRGGRQLRKAQLRRQAAAAGVDVAAWTAIREQQQRTSAQAAVLNEGSRKGALYVSEAHARRRFEEAARTAGIQVSACATMAVTVRERSTAGSGGGYPGNGGDCRAGSS